MRSSTRLAPCPSAAAATRQRRAASCSSCRAAWRTSPRMASSWLFRSSRLRRSAAPARQSCLAAAQLGLRACPRASSARRAGRGWPCAPRRRRTGLGLRRSRCQRPAASTAQLRSRAGRGSRCISSVLQLGAAVLGPGGLVAALHRRPLLAEAHRLELAVAARPAASASAAPPRRASGPGPGCIRGRRARRCGLRRSMRLLRLAAKRLGMASISGRNSSLTTKLSKSK